MLTDADGIETMGQKGGFNPAAEAANECDQMLDVPWHGHLLPCHVAEMLPHLEALFRNCRVAQVEQVCVNR